MYVNNKTARLLVLLAGVTLILTGCQQRSTTTTATTKVKHVSGQAHRNKHSTKAKAVVASQRTKAVQTILNRYRGQKNIGVMYTDLTTKTSATVNADQSFYAASVAKLPVIAYVQHVIMNHQISWSTAFKYQDAANQLPNAMVSGGTGTLQYESHQNKSYSVADLTQRAIEHSDNQASNQLLYHVAHANSQDFANYLGATMGTKSYQKMMTAKQANQVMIAIWQQQQQANTWLEQTDWSHDKIGSLPVTVAHKIGINGAANNDSAIILGDHQFALSIMTNGWHDAQIAELAKQIYSVAK